jgi:putative nucleotidyltransferase with HDIG domain
MPIEESESGTLTILESTWDELMEVLGKTLDLRDNETAGHSVRVRRYSEEIAKALGRPSEEVKQIVRAALLHDLGKVAIPDAILRKNGKLSSEEWRVMETHVWVGFSLLRRIQILSDVAEIVLSHHERFDGRGYPRALKGEEIPIGARIFSVADTLDAMTSDRPYRRAQSFAAARQEIIKESGRQFDPRVVESFLSIPEMVFHLIVLQEKRCSARPPFHGLVKCNFSGRQYALEAVNISEGGMLLARDEGIPLGMEIEVEFILPPLPLPLRTKAEAIRRELPDRTAIAFKSIGASERKAIQQFIARFVEV